VPTAPDRRGDSPSGFAFSIGAYLLWGALPLYFLLLAPSGPFEIVAFRILMSLAFCALLLTATRAWRPFLALLRDGRVLGTMALAGVLIYVNWQTYVIAITSGRVIEGALGYFINPLVTVLLGVLVLRERLRVAQWAAIGIATVAILVIALGYGEFPWISLALAFSFGLYGFIKKRVGDRIDAVSGLTLETLWLAPVAAVQLVVVGLVSGLVVGTAGAGHVAAMIGAGVVTAIPLLLFAAGARRLRLVTIGLVQFFAPVIQFLIGVIVLREPMPLERWIGFGLVWVALVILTVDSVRHARHR